MSVQLTPVERRQRKRFTARAKLDVLREWEATGKGIAVAEKHGIHPMTLYRWKKRLDTAAGEFLKGTRPRAHPPEAGIGARESEAEGHGDAALSGTDGLENKIELGLNGRVSRQRYSREKRDCIVGDVEKLRARAMPVSVVLKRLGGPSFHVLPLEEPTRGVETENASQQPTALRGREDRASEVAEAAIERPTDQPIAAG